MKADELKKQWKDGQYYFSKYGRAQYHFRDGSLGKLHKVTISTEICHQENPSDQNYWSSAHFDEALSQVIKARFPELAQAALEVLEERYKESLVAEKNQVLARLAEIRAIEEEA